MASLSIRVFNVHNLMEFLLPPRGIPRSGIVAFKSGDYYFVRCYTTRLAQTLTRKLGGEDAPEYNSTSVFKIKAGDESLVALLIRQGFSVIPWETVITLHYIQREGSVEAIELPQTGHYGVFVPGRMGVVIYCNTEETWRELLFRTTAVNAKKLGRYFAVWFYFDNTSRDRGVFYVHTLLQSQGYSIVCAGETPEKVFSVH